MKDTINQTPKVVIAPRVGRIKPTVWLLIVIFILLFIPGVYLLFYNLEKYLQPLPDPAEKSYQFSFADDFSDSMASTARWQLWSLNDKSVGSFSNGGLLLGSVSSGELSGSRLIFPTAVSGDFAIKVNIREFELVGDSGNVHFGFRNEALSDGFGITLTNSQRKALHLGAIVTSADADKSVGVIDIDSKSNVVIKIIRRGRSVYFYVNDALFASTGGAYDGQGKAVVSSGSYLPDFPKFKAVLDDFLISFDKSL